MKNPQEALETLFTHLRQLLKDAQEQGARVFQEALAREYESSLAKLRPIKSRLAAVDGLIDQVVYALYGLGEAEIRVVEGR